MIKKNNQLQQGGTRATRHSGTPTSTTLLLAAEHRRKNGNQSEQSASVATNQRLGSPADSIKNQNQNKNIKTTKHTST